MIITEKLVLALALLGAMSAAVASESLDASQPPTFDVRRIAHAGGGLDSKTYTNSYQALNTNLASGFEYFEIDFVFTSDERLVCLHDWDRSFKRAFGYATEQPLSSEEFERLASENGKFTNCTLEGLAEWMRQNPEAFIITDVKDNNLKALQSIRKVLPNATNRVIPQIYRSREFDPVKAMGFKQIIWTLYRIRVSDEYVLSWVDKWPRPVAITMPKDRAKSMLPTLLGAKGVPTYVHTVNSAEERDRFIKELGITEIYTDFLLPE